MKLVIVTGMSGAGKTIALKMLEDIGFYCVDNLPISLVDKFVQLVSEGTSIEKAAWIPEYLVGINPLTYNLSAHLHSPLSSIPSSSLQAHQNLTPTSLRCSKEKFNN